MKGYAKEILLQIVPVAIGVYLGFFVSNWAEERKTDKAAARYIENLIAEVTLNKEKIEALAPYHKMLRDSSYQFSLNAKDNDKPNFFQGTQMPPLMKSAFETGIQTGILSNLSLEQIQVLNELYNQQEFYNDFGKTITTGLLAFDFSNYDSNNLKKIASYLSISMTDVVFQEASILEQFDEVLQTLQ
jgi:hypothetical protein